MIGVRFGVRVPGRFDSGVVEMGDEPQGHNPSGESPPRVRLGPTVPVEGRAVGESPTRAESGVVVVLHVR